MSSKFDHCYLITRASPKLIHCIETQVVSDLFRDFLGAGFGTEEFLRRSQRLRDLSEQRPAQMKISEPAIIMAVYAYNACVARKDTVIELFAKGARDLDLRVQELMQSA
ncbi:hypothetical protein ACFL1X_13145 [Candidatus Hydrogenedentota bacterium]